MGKMHATVKHLEVARKSRSWVAALFCALLMAACGGSGEGASLSGAAPPPGSATIGADGGTVQGIDGVSVTIPAGALRDPVTIRIARANTDSSLLPQVATAIGPTYELTPHGIQFTKPVTVSIPFDASQLPASGRPLVAKSNPAQPWDLYEVAAEAVVAGKVSVDVRSFSFVAPVITPATRLQPLQSTVTLAPDASNSSTKWVTTKSFGITTLALTPALASPRVLSLSVNVDPSLGCELARRALVVVDTSGRTGEANIAGTEPSTGAAAVQFWPGAAAGSAAVTPVADCWRGGVKTRVIGQTTIATVDVVAAATTVPWSSEILPYTDVPANVPVDVDLSFFTTDTVSTVDPVDRTVKLTPLVLIRKSADGSFSGPLSPADTVGAITATSCIGGVCEFKGQLTLSASGGSWYLRAYFTNSLNPVTDGSIGPFLDNPRPVSVTTHPVAPTFRTQPVSISVMPGTTASLNVVVDGSPASKIVWQYASKGSTQWLYANQLPTYGTGASLTVGPLGTADDGLRVRAVAIPLVGSPVLSQEATIGVTAAAVVPQIVGEPADATVVAGQQAVFTATASGTAALSYQWLHDGQPIAGAYADTLKVNAAGASDAGRYQVVVTNAAGSATSRAALLTVGAYAPLAAPVVLAQPASVSAAAGSAVNFAVSLSSLDAPAFQWRKDGAPLAGQTAALLSLPAIAAGDAGRYDVVVRNVSGSVTSASAVLTVTEASATAPTIQVSPIGGAYLPGASVTLVVAASGSGPLNYQWSHDGAAIPGANSATLTLSSLGALDAGGYTVEVANAAGRVVSSAARILLVGAPVIAIDPSPASVIAGSTATFTVVATGDGLRYQWLRDGIAIGGATSASYTTPVLTSADSGAAYGVVVYNGAGLLFSRSAALSVTSGLSAGMAMLAGDFSGGGGGGAADGVGTGARLDTPEALVYDGAGHLYVATSNSQRIARIDTASSQVTTIFAAGGVDIGYFASIALAPDGSLFSASSQYCGLYRITGAAGPTPVGTQIRLSSCTGTRGLAVNAAGAVLMADPGWNAVWQATADGAGAWSNAVAYGPASLYTGAGASDGQGASIRFNAPRGLALDASGNLWVADTGNHVIRRITPSRVSTTPFGTPGVAGEVDGANSNARFNSPIQLAFDPNGNLIVLDFGDASNGYAKIVRRVSPAGVVSTLFNAGDEAAALGSPAQDAFARSIRGLAVLDANHIALTAGNAVVLRTLP